MDEAARNPPGASGTFAYLAILLMRARDVVCESWTPVKSGTHRH